MVMCDSKISLTSSAILNAIVFTQSIRKTSPKPLGRKPRRLARATPLAERGPNRVPLLDILYSATKL